MKALMAAGRIIYTIPFIVNGIFHFLQGPMFATMVPLPGGIIWVYLLGALMILASLAIITKIGGKIGSLILAFILLSFIALIHVPNLDNPEMGQMAMANLVKDAGLLGGALILAGLFAYEDEFVHRERRGEVTVTTPRPTV